jgi:hypothetical protein
VLLLTLTTSVSFLLCAGDTEIFSCSGTIVEYEDDTAYVVTSASLITCPDKDEQVNKPKVAGLFSSCTSLSFFSLKRYKDLTLFLQIWL